MNKKSWKPLFALSILGLVQALNLATPAHASQRKWNNSNDPLKFDPSYNINFLQLPPTGDITQGQKGWSDSYWPKTRGYIAERWQDPRYSGPYQYQKYPMVSLNRVKSMTPAELNLLSPAEKFDILTNDSKFSVTTKLRKEDASPNDWWRGLCNGWAHASSNIDEPKAIMFKSPINGVTLPLASSDIKGLLAYFYSKGLDQNGSRYIGRSCRDKSKLIFGLDGACRDVHPAAMHIALMNEIGIKKQAITMDRDPTVQVWNHPFVKYNMVIDRVEDRKLSKDASKGTRKEVYVTMTAYYSNELYHVSPEEIEDGKTRADYEDDRHVSPQPLPVLGTEHQEYGSVVYKYVLELDARDQIVGGEWLNDTDSIPDLIWKQNFSLPGEGANAGRNQNWNILTEILRQATSMITP